MRSGLGILGIFALLSASATPVLALDMDMSCAQFTTMEPSGMAEAVKEMKAAAAAAGTETPEVAAATSVENLAMATNTRCQVNPAMTAMDAMLKGN